MDYVKLGRSGLKVSRLCLGCMTYGVPDCGTHEWTLPEDESRPFIKRALELGITFFDTSNSYSDGTSEEILGRALKDFAKRDEVVIATKVFFPMRKDPAAKGLSRKNILAEIDHSLRRLGTDYVDLYQNRDGLPMDCATGEATRALLHEGVTQASNNPVRDMVARIIL